MNLNRHKIGNFFNLTRVDGNLIFSLPGQMLIKFFILGQLQTRVAIFKFLDDFRHFFIFNFFIIRYSNLKNFLFRIQKQVKNFSGYIWILKLFLSWVELGKSKFSFYYEPGANRIIFLNPAKPSEFIKLSVAGSYEKFFKFLKSQEVEPEFSKKLKILELLCSARRTNKFFDKLLTMTMGYSKKEN